MRQVKTEDGSELARVTIVNRKCEAVYDSFVLPEKPIVDYATRYSPFRFIRCTSRLPLPLRRWSGITPEKMVGVTTRLKDVQTKLTELFDFNTILVGHSLDCDLRALKVGLCPQNSDFS